MQNQEKNNIPKQAWSMSKYHETRQEKFKAKFW